MRILKSAFWPVLPTYGARPGSTFFRPFLQYLFLAQRLSNRSDASLSQLPVHLFKDGIARKSEFVVRYASPFRTAAENKCLLAFAGRRGKCARNGSMVFFLLLFVICRHHCFRFVARGQIRFSVQCRRR